MDAERVSPGPISRVHALSAGIADSDCEACHGEDGDDLLAGCGSCHADTVQDVQTKRGFHGQLSDGASCERCHAEHHGVEHQLVAAPVYALAGVADLQAYTHAGLNFGLVGAHASLRCEQCHPHAHKELLAKGEHRFDGLTQSCASCHKDPHEGKLPDCAACHGQEQPFRETAHFEHTTSFPLEGVHAGQACTACHAKNTERSIENYAHAKPAERTCVDCHTQPHTQEFLMPEPSCIACHTLDGGSFAQAQTRLTPAQHAASGFALAKPHDQLDCKQCHTAADATQRADVAFRFAAAHPGRKADDCASCHQDPHGGQFAASPGGATNCLACHDRHAFEPHAFDLVDHAQAGFVLDGAHASTGCEACHKIPADAPAGQGTRQFRNTESTCASCHSDAHRGMFAARGTEDCKSCHSTHDFAVVAQFDHARHTGFALEGKHAAAKCESCHTPLSSPDLHGRRFGYIERAGPPQACESCHADVHEGSFADAQGQTNCESCHTTVDFQHYRNFDHARDAKFALQGAHARVDCASCHSTPPRYQGKQLNDCRSCHDDAHSGMFGTTSCTQCHTDESWSVAGFDHARWTQFPLDGAHAQAACNDCHAGNAKLDTSCVSCHADIHVGQFQTGGTNDCARCHSTSGKFQADRFDHDKHARFRLDSRHDDLSCAACHRQATTTSGQTAVRYKPLGTECSDCHGFGFRDDDKGKGRGRGKGGDRGKDDDDQLKSVLLKELLHDA